MRQQDLSKVYETFFSIPSMNEKIKLTLQLPRKSAFVLSKLIERSLAVTAGAAGIPWRTLLEKDLGEELDQLPAEIMEKTGLTEFNHRFQALTEEA